MKKPETIYFTKRQNWRNWLESNFETKDEVWLEYPKKETGRPRISYNDAVEEALCFGWIDSTIKPLDAETTIQRFSKRKNLMNYSQSNKERLKWLLDNGLVHESVLQNVEKVANEKFIFPKDILAKIKSDKNAWTNYQKFSESYKRIRIAYIEGARIRPEEFKKRLEHFIAKTKDNKMIKGFGGIEKYY